MHYVQVLGTVWINTFIVESNYLWTLWLSEMSTDVIQLTGLCCNIFP